MAINERLIDTEVAAAPAVDTDNLMLDLDASDVDSYDGDGDIWYDIHDFEYKPTTNVAQHFNTVLYDGDDNTVAQPITGAGFTPDLVWIKTRNQATRNILTDSIRGVSSQLFSNETSVPTDYAEFTSFDNDGFTVKRNTGTDYLNQSGIEYVAWCFKAGGASVTNTNGDLQSQVSANNDLGFSIVSYTGNNSFGQTVGHGLDVQPQMVIYKNLSNARNWRTYVEAIGATKYLNLDDNSAGGAYGSFNNTSPTSTVFSTTNSIADRATNFNGDNFIAYCFTSKRGVSKVGSYIGDGSTSNKIYTGFEPAFVLQKRTDNTSNWRIFDNVRGTEKELYANSSAQEPSDVAYIDFNRDGFTLTSNINEINGASAKYIYYAVAKNTNETSLIAGTNLELGLDAGTYSGSGNWLDSSGNSNDGTITGATWEQELGNFFDFDGTSDKVTVSPTSFNAASELTVEGWINKDNDSTFQTIISLRGSASIDTKLLVALNTDGTLRLDSATASGFVTLYSGSASYKTTVGKWHHVAASIDYTNKNWAFYLDGEKIDNGTNNSIKGGSGFSISSFGIGVNFNTQYFDGKVGQVRTYTSILTLAQIRQNYNFTKPNYPNYFHGTLGAGTAKPAWNAGGYFDFDGSNDKVDISSITIPLNDFSYSLWFKTDSTTKKQILLSHYNGGFSYGIQLNQNASSAIGSYALQEGGSTNYIATNSITLDTTDWHNVVLTKSSFTGHILYYDGNQIAIDSSFTGPLQRGTTTNQIGASTSANFFDGQISKFRVYDNVLTTTEITALYNEGE